MLPSYLMKKDRKQESFTTKKLWYVVNQEGVELAFFEHKKDAVDRANEFKADDQRVKVVRR